MNVEERYRDAAGVYDMIRERLDALGCTHGKDHGATPPMMFPEWISCVVAGAYQRGAEAMRAAILATLRHEAGPAEAELTPDEIAAAVVALPGPREAGRVAGVRADGLDAREL